MFRYLLWIVLLTFSYSGYHVVLATTKSKKVVLVLALTMRQDLLS